MYKRLFVVMGSIPLRTVDEVEETSRTSAIKIYGKLFEPATNLTRYCFSSQKYHCEDCQLSSISTKIFSGRRCIGQLV